MMRLTYALVAVLALFGGARCDLVEDVKKTIEDFRAIMPTGSGDIPPLEPVSVTELPLSVKVTPFNAKIVASNITAAGASSFEITQISLRDDGKLSLSLEIPSIEVTGHYNINGKVKVGFISVKLSGNGPLTLSAGGIKGDGIADVVEDEYGALHINDLQISSWSYKKFKVHLDNLFGGGVMGKTVNSLINKIVPSFIESNKKKINQILQSKAMTFINKYLDGISGKATLSENKKPSLGEWVISRESQELLEQLANTIVAEQALYESESTPTVLEEQAAKLLESFKAMMKEGRPDFHIPVLDPAIVDTLRIDIKHSLFSAKVTATDAKVQGVSDLSVTRIHQVEGTNKVTVDLEVPDIKIESTVEMVGKVSIPFAPAINDKGPVQLNITDLKLTATADVLANADGSYSLKTVVVDTWTFGTIKVHIDNLLGGGFFGKQANNLLNTIFPTVVQNDRAKINEKLENVIKSLLNTYLDGLAGKTYDDLSNEVYELSEVFRTAMKAGLPNINIPVMDPATVEDISVQFNKWPVKAELDLSSLTVSGASEFKLTKVSQIVGTNKVLVQFEVPLISATSTYDLKTTIFMLKANRRGPAVFKIRNLSGSAIAQLSNESDRQLSLLGLEVQDWDYDSLEVEVDNWSNAGFFKRLINSLINKLLPGLLIKPHVSDVTTWASLAGERVIGRFLDAVAGRVVLPNLDVTATSLLEQLRAIMKTGSEQYKMPVYDPASVDEIRLEVSVLKQTASLLVTDIKVHGTSDFLIAKITQEPNTNTLNIDVSAPSVHAHCLFTATTKGIFKLEDAGSATADITNLKVSATAALASKIDGSLVLRDLKVQSWSFEEVKVAFENLDKLGKLGKALSLVINKVVPTIVKANTAALTDWAEASARNVLDTFLEGVAAQTAPAA